jgi:hypothetical protein
MPIESIVAKSKPQPADRLIYGAKLVTCLAIWLGWMPTIVAQQELVPTNPEICEVDFGLLKSDLRTDRFNQGDPSRDVRAAVPKRKALLSSSDLEMNRDRQRVPPARSNIITADTVSAKGMTLPSLWWTSEQFPAKLVTNWIADRNQKQVYILVNTQYWGVLDYIDRYRTIDQFGRVAQGYGYDLKLCSSQKIVLARYSCTEIDAPNERLRQQSSCQIWLNATGQNGLGVQGK